MKRSNSLRAAPSWSRSAPLTGSRDCSHPQALVSALSVQAENKEMACQFEMPTDSAHASLGRPIFPAPWLAVLSHAAPHRRTLSPGVQMELPALAWAPTWKFRLLGPYMGTGGSCEGGALRRSCSSHKSLAVLPFQWRGERSPFSSLKPKEWTPRHPFLHTIHVTLFRNHLPTFKSLFF